MKKLPPGFVYDQDEMVFPWETKLAKAKYATRRPTRFSLRHWRLAAVQHARRMGAKHACDWCRRPCNHSMGRVTLRSDGSSNVMKRQLCRICTDFIRETIWDLEWKMAGRRIREPVEEPRVPTDP